MRKLSVEQWIPWIAATATAALTMAAYAFSTFETKEHAAENKGDIVHRLDQIDAKLDRVIERLPPPAR